MISQKNFLNPIYLMAAMLLFSSCNALPFDFLRSSEDANTYPRAFFVDQRVTDRIDNRLIRVNGNMDDVVRVVTNVIEQQTDTTTNMLRVPEEEMGTGTLQPYIRISTPPISLDDLNAFREYFFLGEYLLDRPDIRVRAENFKYQVEATLYVRGQEFLVEFRVRGDNDWNIYRITNDNERMVSPSDRVKYGVGSYRYREPSQRVNWRGNMVDSYDWTVIEIDDNPTTRGELEFRLRNRMIEISARENLNAAITRSIR